MSQVKTRNPCLFAGSNVTIEATLYDEDGTVIDLTSATVNIIYKIGTAAATTEAAAVQSPETAGKVQFQFSDGDLVAGTMQYQFHVTQLGNDWYSEIIQRIVLAILV